MHHYFPFLFILSLSFVIILLFFSVVILMECDLGGEHICVGDESPDPDSSAP